MELEGSLTSSQQPVTDPYSDPKEFQTFSHFTLRSILVIHSHLRPSAPINLYLSDFATRNMHVFLFSLLRGTFLPTCFPISK
jgi:hypothetical protein